MTSFSTIATAWRPLCEELETRLQGLDPPGELLAAGVDSSGLLRFQVRLDPRVRSEGRRLVREYEHRALEVCELCGGAGHVHAGVIVTARCDHCI